MQAIIKKYLQSVLFYLLFSVLIMMAGIIVGYLWSGNIGLWIYSRNISDSIGISDILTFLGVLFTILTYLLARKAYRQWRHPFILDKHQRLVALNGLISKMGLLNIKYQRALIELRKNIGRDSYFTAREIAVDRLLEYEELVTTVSAYDDLLLNLADNPDKAKTFALQYSMSCQINELMNSGKNGDIDFEKFKNQTSLTLEFASVVGAQVYKRITESANKIPS